MDIERSGFSNRKGSSGLSLGSQERRAMKNFQCLRCGDGLVSFLSRDVEADPVVKVCNACGFEWRTSESGRLAVWNNKALFLWSEASDWLLVPEGCLLIVSSEEL